MMEECAQRILSDSHSCLLHPAAGHNASPASLVQAVSSHVTVQVEGHVTPGPESAANDVLQAFMEINVSWHVSLVPGARGASVNASAKRSLWAVTQSLVNVRVRPASLETTVKRLPVLTSRMFYLGPQCARTAFTVLTVARCASAGTVPAATTSQEPAYAPPAGQDHTAFWDALRVIMGSSAVRDVSVRMEPGVTTSPGDAAARPGGLESAANCPAFRGPTALPVPDGASARPGCPVTMRQGAVGAQPDSRGLAVKNDVERGLSGQTASPDAAASMVVAVTSGLGLATVLLASSELTVAQVVRVGTMGRTVQSCAPVGREGSATQPPGGVSVPPVRWDSPASKHVRGGATACSAETRVAVTTGACVTQSTGLANADWAGLDPAVTQGKYGLDCAQDCSCLNNGTCDRFTGTCSCPAGNYGHSCQHSTQTLTYDGDKVTGCPSGFFGVNCARTCDCKVGQTCDHVTGQCVCPPGYYGSQCQRYCGGDRFGPDCSLPCQCSPTGPAVMGSVDGACAHSPGWAPPVVKLYEIPDLPTPSDMELRALMSHSLIYSMSKE
ncbi:hypothetical protein L3Q82_005018 [Scortum barcoo]|uniref:Uncharacterized protein n=1 Tax=Scortum barcoo TaxID=214431 RepID=A0ACB8VE05_9TELE|nr:hypothetical protein L3Q82_005018 [Scortum barcoo]